MLLTAALIKTLFVKKSTDSVAKPAISWTKEEEALYADKLSTMIQCPTVSTFGGNERAPFAEYHELLKKLFPVFHAKAERTIVGKDALVYKLPGQSSQKAYMFTGHMDVVPAAETDWIYPAFSGTIADGKVWGRGAVDCKNTSLFILQALEELLSAGFTPKYDIYYGSSDGEEVSGDGAPHIVEYLKSKNVKITMLLDEGGAIMSNLMSGITTPCAVVGIMEKGFGDVQFIAKHTGGGHSSTPSKNTPLARLAALITDVEKHNYFKKTIPSYVKDTFKALAPELPFGLRYVVSNLWLFGGLLKSVAIKLSPTIAAMFQTTICFTMAKGSAASNIIPQTATVTANMRFSVHQSPEECFEILQKLCKKHNVEMQVLTANAASNVVDTKGEEFLKLKNALAVCCPDVTFAPYMVMGATDARHYDSVTDCALRFSPVRMTMDQMNKCHASNEHIDIPSLAEGVKVMKYFIENL